MSSEPQPQATDAAPTCPPGWRNDDFLQFIVPSSGVCSLNQQTHYILAAVWTALLLFHTIELYSGFFLRLIPRLKRAAPATPVTLAVCWTCVYVGTLIIWVVVLIAPNASVANSMESAGLWVGVFLFQIGGVGYLVAKNNISIKPLLAAIGMENGNDAGEASFFRFMRRVQICQLVVFFCGNLVCFIIVPNVVPDIQAKADAAIAGFALFGGCLVLSILSVVVIQMRIRSIALAQVKFQTDLPSNSEGDDEQTQALRLLARRMLLSSVFIVILGCSGSLVWLLMGSVIPISWIVVHSLYGGLVAIGAFLGRSTARDSFLYSMVCCRVNFDTTPRSTTVGKNSSRSEDNSTTGNKSSQDGINTVGLKTTDKRNGPRSPRQSNSVGVDRASTDRQPSKMLETIDINELTRSSATSSMDSIPAVPLGTGRSIPEGLASIAEES